MTFGEKLGQLLEERGISQRKLAKLVPCHDGHLSRLRRGLYMPSAEMAARLDEVLDANGSLAALRPKPQPGKPGGTVDRSPTPYEGDDEMERRALLRLATLGMGAGTLGAEPLGRMVDVALTAAPRDLDDWHLACDDHLYAVRTRPPVEVRRELVIDLLALDRELKSADAQGRIELQRVQAALATLHANVLTRLGEHGLAIRWWRTAKAAADTTNDLDLRIGVRVTEAGHGLFGQREPATVLRLATQAQRIAGRSPRKALLTYTTAKALTQLGRHSEARCALDAFRGSAETAPATHGIMAGYWNDFQSDWVELQVYAAMGDEPKANQAAEHNLARIVDGQYVPMVHLHRALCTVVNGGTDRGAGEAVEILDALPPAQRSHMIMQTGKTVLRAVPIDQRDRPAVRELRVLTSA